MDVLALFERKFFSFFHIPLDSSLIPRGLSFLECTYLLLLGDRTAVLSHGRLFTSYSEDQIEAAVGVLQLGLVRDVRERIEEYKEILNTAEPEDFELLRQLASSCSGSLAQLIQRDISLEMAAAMVAIAGSDLPENIFAETR